MAVPMDAGVVGAALLRGVLILGIGLNFDELVGVQLRLARGGVDGTAKHQAHQQQECGERTEARVEAEHAEAHSIEIAGRHPCREKGTQRTDNGWMPFRPVNGCCFEDRRMAEPIIDELGLEREQRKIRRGALWAFLLSIAVLAIAHISWPQIVSAPVDHLEERLAFWAGASLSLIVWVLIGVGMVSTGRRRSKEDIRGSAYAPPSARIAVASAFLQNTLEQSFIAIVTQLALVLLVGSAALPFIAGSCVLFAIGRVTFLRGYPTGAGGRAFGMALTALPSLFAFVFGAAAVVQLLMS